MHTFTHASLIGGLVGAVVFNPLQLTAQRPETKPATARLTAPSGTELAEAVRAGRVDPANAVTSTVLGKRFKFTPAQSRDIASAAEENVKFLGILENGAAGDETGLPPGRYNLSLAKVGGQWKGYAESGGRLVGSAVRASFGAASSVGGKPVFHEKGWCITGMWYEETTRVGGTGKSINYHPWRVCF